MRKIFMAVAFIFAMTLAATSNATSWAYATITAEGAWYIDRDSVYLDRNENGDVIFHAFVKKELSGKERAKPESQLPTTEGAGLSIPLTVFTVSEVQSPMLLSKPDIIGWLTSPV